MRVLLAIYLQLHSCFLIILKKKKEKNKWNQSYTIFLDSVALTANLMKMKTICSSSLCVFRDKVVRLLWYFFLTGVNFHFTDCNQQ